MGVSYSAVHGLGVIPVEAVLELTCLTPEIGYSVGDVVTPLAMWNGVSDSTLMQYKNSTTVGVPMFSGYQLYISNKSSGLSVSPTAANWSYRFRLRAA